jgi:hypothetical protein
LVECQHGITYDHALVIEQHRNSEDTEVFIRERWPRLNGKCPLGCGYEGLYYATLNHYSWGWGDEDGPIPMGYEVGASDDDD